MNTYTCYVTGTHCASCKIFIEDTLIEHPGISRVDVDLHNETVSIDTMLDEPVEVLIHVLSQKIKQNGYTLSVEKNLEEKNKSVAFWQALPIGLGFLCIFFLLQKSGILNFGVGSTVTPVTSFLIGLVASVSSCLAVVGGLVLSLSAKVSQDTVRDTKTFTLFHVGRLGSFAVLGGVLGAIGSAIGINVTFTAILGIIASLVMIYLGVNLIGVFAKYKVTLPAGMFNFFRNIEHKTFTPLILGFSTFFLPCGFTQSMQVSALSSGSFLSGFLIMLAFSLGTLPMLVLLSFGSASFSHSVHAPLFFKSAGIIVIGLGVFALLAGLAGLGVIPPLFSI